MGQKKSSHRLTPAWDARSSGKRGGGGSGKKETLGALRIKSQLPKTAGGRRAESVAAKGYSLAVAKGTRKASTADHKGSLSPCA